MNKFELLKHKEDAIKNNFKYLYDAITVYEEYGDISGFVRAIKSLELIHQEFVKNEAH